MPVNAANANNATNADKSDNSNSADTSEYASILSNQGLTEVTEHDLMGIDDASDDSTSDTKSKDDGDKDNKNEDATDTSKSTESKDDDSKTDADKSDDISGKSDKDNTDAKDDESDKSKDSKDTKKDDTVDKKSTTESKSATSKSKVDNTPPKGFVPTAALHEARGENAYLKEQIRNIQDKFEVLLTKESNSKSTDKSDDLVDFKELSEQEYTTLVDAEPAKALIYMQKLVKFQQQNFTKLHQEQSDSQAREHELQIMTSVHDTMESIVPGLFDKESKSHDELVEFADSIGFTDELFYLTNPQTQIILPGETEPLFLADQAAAILQMLVNTRTKIGEKIIPDKDTEAETQKTLEAKIRKEVETELLTKFKSDKEGTFKSLQQLSKTKDTDGFGDTVLSEKQYSKLSSAEQELYLSGSE